MVRNLTRRQFLDYVGRVGGASAVYSAAAALELLPAAARADAPRLKTLAPGERRSIAILGAGIGGLTAAYELQKAGYECVVLEASHRAGGRNMTLRAGDVVDELGNRQVCEFDSAPHLYMNAGPARIPPDHTRLLHYCKSLGVPLEIFVNENRHAWLHDENAFGGKPVRNRRYVTDARGFIAELMAKSVKRAEFDEPLNGVDVERVERFLRAFGDLGPGLNYHGSSRAGHASGGMVVPGIEHEPLDASEVFKAYFWSGPMNWGQQEFQGAPMMQPVGGMDRVVDAFMARVADSVVLNAQVRSIRLQETGVSVAYEREGRIETLEADYCFNNIPSQILCGIENNFPADYRQALSGIKPGRLFKIGLQARRRFWEDEGIYGGISWTSQDITQIWYPSHGIFAHKGILLGAYTFGEEGGTKFGRMTPAQRIEAALEQGSQIHPNFRENIENGVSVVWHRMNHMLGCAAQWTDALMESSFGTLQAPAGRHYLIGDQTSFHPGWQEGAIASAHRALSDLNARIDYESPSRLSQA
jgi:monoamine oxidase